MSRIACYPLLLMLLVPRASSALELRWSGGSTELNLAVATRCTLVVQADSTEGRLPAEWRLLWVADSASIQFVAMDSLEACLLDEAQVSRIDGPATAADSAANQITAHFCSEEGNEATLAHPTGVTEVAWDGRDQGGALVVSGIYFVRLAFAGGARLSKIVMLR